MKKTTKEDLIITLSSKRICKMCNKHKHEWSPTRNRTTIADEHWHEIDLVTKKTKKTNGHAHELEGTRRKNGAVNK